MKKHQHKAFSHLESAIIDLLQTNKKQTISELAEAMYHKDFNAPLNPNNSITTAIRQINMKCEREGLKWMIDGYGAGRRGKTVFIKNQRRETK